MIYDVKPLEKKLEQELRDLREHVKSQPELTLIVGDNDLNDDDRAYIRSIERIMKKFDISVKTVHQFSMDNLDTPKITSPFIKIKSDLYTENLPAVFDLDGSGYVSNGLMFVNSNLPHHNPCTAEAIMMVLHDIEERYFGNFKKQGVSVYGRGKVGLPTALLMTRDNRTVTVFHSKSNRAIFDEGLWNDVLVFATGHRDIINKDDIIGDDIVHFPYPFIIIDAGINVDEDGKIVGDVNPNVYKKAKDYLDIVITPVPGGVGRITPLILVKHVLQTYRSFDAVKTIESLIKKD